MKTKILLTVAAALVTVLALNLNASTPLLTPRAATNQPKVAAQADNTVVAVSPKADRSVLLTPRAAGNQIVHVKAVASLPVAKCQLIGTPRSITAAGSSARMSCCGMTVATCSSTGMCAKSN